MANKKESLSATNLADFHHLNCDLYLWLTYNGGNPDTDSSKDTSRSELTRAQLHRGEEWETTLLAWLDSNNHLLRLPRIPITAEVLQEHIVLDGRGRFFIAGLIFLPPQIALSRRFSDANATPVNFGMAMPDLIEVVLQDGKAFWKVIDAKASSSVKTSHLAQTYFYTLCLNYILDRPFFQSANSVGVWLPPSSGSDVYEPSFSDIKTIDIALLSATLDDFLFRRLPRILSQPQDSVQWHLNPLCKSCRFESDCRKTTIDSGKLGKIPNISLRDANVFKDLLHFSRYRPPPTSTDIEDLHLIVTDHNKMHGIAQQSPMTVKKAKQLLALPRRTDPSSVTPSPVLQSARTDTVQIVPRLNHTFPSSEDIAIIVSLVTDPATPDRNIQAFCISTKFSSPMSYNIKDNYSGRKGEFIKTLATLIRTLHGIQEKNNRPFSVQFYVWSVNERSILQKSIIQAALSEDIDTDDVRLCIGALAEGASLLQTVYQPLLLSDALTRLRKEYQAYSRNSLNNTEDRRQRVEAAIKRLEAQNSNHESATERKREFGQVPRVVALQQEVERSFALPIPGYWDLPECATAMLSSSQRESCPSDEKLYKAYKDGSDASFWSLLYTRNYFLFTLLDEVRKKLNEASLLVNEARLFSVQLMDLCRNDTLRKLFYMQQFEVLTKLGELWNSRIGGCPDAPILEFRSRSSVNAPTEYNFKLVSGMIEAPPDKWTLYDYLLVRDSTSFDSESPIPVEALFDDLAVSGLVFPLNRSTETTWKAQPSIVQERLAVVSVINVKAVGRETIVTLHIWKAGKLGLKSGVHYHLSPRYVDFNIPKVLSSLFEVDLQYETNAINLDEGRAGNLDQIPYLHFILEPQSFGCDPLAKTSLEYEAEIQRTLEQLKDLNVTAAGSLVLKSSQQRAVQRILANRLTVIWGPPGTGKTYTICLSLLRLIQVQERQKNYNRRIIFLTAMTHAAIDALQDKLAFLMGQYRMVDSLPTHWLDDVVVERVKNGAVHKEPPKGLVHIYTGTLYQLYKFAKKKNLKVNTLVVDEAGQISLSYLALVMLFLSPEGRIVVAGDSEQLAPILSGQYPRLNGTAVFGSVLEYLVSSYSPTTGTSSDSPTANDVLRVSWPGELVVQLNENFRLNPDLGEFISIIYPCQFIPQKIQPRQLALVLERTSMIETNWTDIRMDIWEAIRGFLRSLSAVMLKKSTTTRLLKPPRHILSTQEATGIFTSSQLSHRPISFALIRLRTQSLASRHIPYEVHIQGEAVVAAALVEFFKKCSPSEDIFVATPHRIQREAVKTVLDQSPNLRRLEDEKVKVDTIERLQGSEAAFVICLFSLPPSPSNDLGFFLERRRLNVAISRAKKLCILVTSDEVLRPSVHILANESAAKGFGFLKAFEARAWSFELAMDLDEGY